jgi:hypothetical protein
MLADAKRVARRNQPDLTNDELARRFEHLLHCDLREFAEEANRKLVARLGREYWVLSFAGNRDHPLLWSHYANGHSGLCIHFASDRGVFGAAQRVHYGRHRPTLLFPFTGVGSKQVAVRATLRKGLCWRYEEEFRFIRYPDTQYADVGLDFKGQSARFDPKLVTGVTVGARPRDEYLPSVLTLAKKHTPPVPVWRANPSKNSYDFHFDRIN